MKISCQWWHFSQPQLELCELDHEDDVDASDIRNTTATTSRINISTIIIVSHNLYRHHPAKTASSYDYQAGKACSEPHPPKLLICITSTTSSAGRRRMVDLGLVLLCACGIGAMHRGNMGAHSPDFPGSLACWKQRESVGKRASQITEMFSQVSFALHLCFQILLPNQ